VFPSSPVLDGWNGKDEEDVWHDMDEPKPVTKPAVAKKAGSMKLGAKKLGASKLNAE
jgi:hypothetical protein